MPGGVNSPVRAFRAVGGDPIFVRAAHGAVRETVDGERLTDYVLSWGPLLLGHDHPAVRSAIQEALARGTSYGFSHPAEAELAELVSEMVPSVEMVRFVNSGTEATMAAVRLARAATGRDLILKFDGCYPRDADSFLVGGGPRRPPRAGRPPWRGSRWSARSTMRVRCARGSSVTAAGSPR